MLTAFAGIHILFQRLSIDRVLFTLLFKVNTCRWTNHYIILAIFCHGCKSRAYFGCRSESAVWCIRTRFLDRTYVVHCRVCDAQARSRGDSAQERNIVDKHDVLLVHGIFEISRNCVLRRKGVAVFPCLRCSDFCCGISDAVMLKAMLFVPEKQMACY